MQRPNNGTAMGPGSSPKLVSSPPPRPQLPYVTPTSEFGTCCTLSRQCASELFIHLPGDQIGLVGKVADAFNEIAAANERMAQQLEFVGQMVGKEGKTRKRVNFESQRAPGEKWKLRSTP